MRPNPVMSNMRRTAHMRRQRAKLIRAAVILRDLGHDDAASKCDAAIVELTALIGGPIIDDEYPV